MKQIQNTKIVNSEQAELDRLKHNLNVFESLKQSVLRVKENCARSKIDVSYSTQNIEYEIDSTLKLLGETYAKNQQRVETETFERKKLQIFGTEIRTGDRVRLTNSEMEYFNDVDSIKKRGRVSRVGVVVFRCIGYKEIDLDNTEPNVELDLFICFASGQTLRVSSTNVEKIKPKVKAKQNPAVACEVAAEGENQTNVLKLNNGVGA